MDMRNIRYELSIAIGHAEEATEAAKKMLERIDYKTLEIRAVTLSYGEIAILLRALSVTIETLGLPISGDMCILRDKLQSFL